jgi:hypothetical protein
MSGFSCRTKSAIQPPAVPLFIGFPARDIPEISVLGKSVPDLAINVYPHRRLPRMNLPVPLI